MSINRAVNSERRDWLVFCSINSIINTSPKEKIKGHEPANVMIIRRSFQSLTCRQGKS